MKRKNKGFTLIEVMVTIAIIAIFTGVVTMLISNGSASYRNTSSNARVQMETQETLDQLQDLVIDANRTIYYGNGTVADLSLIPNDIDGGGLDDASVKTLVVCSASDAISGDSAKEDYVWDVITWKAEEQKLYYNSYSKKDQPKYQEPILTPSPAEGAPSPEGGASVVSDASTAETAVPTPEPVSMDGAETVVSQSVFASDIVGFWADIHEVETKGIIRFQIQARKNSKTIETLHTVNLRNKVRIEKPGDISSLPSSDARIVITNPPAELSDDCGGYLFEKVTFGDVQAGSISWTVTGANGTTVNGWEFPDSSYGKMIIQDHADSPGNFITVTVTATSISGKTISDSCKVKIVSTVKAEGLIPNPTPLILGVGNTYDLNDLVTFSVRYSNGKETSVEPTSITWSGNIDVIEISPAGTVSEIPQTLGADSSNSLYKAIATYHPKDGEQDISLQAEIPIQIARVDLKKPNKNYFVGENKELEYEYKVGGSVVSNQNATIHVENTDPNSQSSMNYEAGKPFTEKEVGNWKATITVPVNGSEKTVSSSSTFQVKQSSLTAEIVVVDHKTTLLPGEDAEMYLVLKDKNTGAMITEASVSWDNNIGQKEFAGKQGSVTFTADENDTPVTITATYTLKDSIKGQYTNPEGFANVTFSISKLFMTVTSDRYELAQNKSANLKATIRNAENNEDVTKDYTISWKIENENTSLYTLTPNDLIPSNAEFKVTGAVTEITLVKIIVTGTKGTTSFTEVCELTIYPPDIYQKIYYLIENQPQSLEHGEISDHFPTGTFKSYLMDYNGNLNELSEAERSNLLDISMPANNNWSVTLKNRSLWDSFEYMMLVVDYDNAKYYYYLYPAEYNVYNAVGLPLIYKFVKQNIFVPGDTNMILKSCVLLDDGYTYQYGNYKLRYSIHRMTGWNFLGGWINSSAGKWFLKINDKYYRYSPSNKRWEQWLGVHKVTEDYIRKHWNNSSLDSHWQKWN